MEWWGERRLATDVFIQQHGIVAAFIFLLVEEAGVQMSIASMSWRSRNSRQSA